MVLKNIKNSERSFFRMGGDTAQQNRNHDNKKLVKPRKTPLGTELNI